MAMKQYLPLQHHVLNACGLGAGCVLMCWAEIVLMPACHAPRRSFHVAMPVAEQLWQVAQRDQVRIFRIGFRSRQQRRTGTTPRTTAARSSRLSRRQLVLSTSSVRRAGMSCRVNVYSLSGGGP
jgi:hypothetical protein